MKPLPIGIPARPLRALVALGLWSILFGAIDARAQALDSFGALDAQQATELLRLLTAANAAEGEERWSEAGQLYLQMYEVLPLEEYRFRMALCLEEEQSYVVALAIYRELVDSPREVIASSATARIRVIEALLANLPARLRASTNRLVEPVNVGRGELALTTPGQEDGEAEEGGRDPTLPILFGSLAVAVASTGLAFGLVSRSRAQAERDYDALGTFNSRAEADALGQEAEDFAIAANISFAAAGVFAVTAIVLFVTGANTDEANESQVAHAPLLRPGGGGGALTFEF